MHFFLAAPVAPYTPVSALYIFPLLFATEHHLYYLLVVCTDGTDLLLSLLVVKHHKEYPGITTGLHTLGTRLSVDTKGPVTSIVILRTCFCACCVLYSLLNITNDDNEQCKKAVTSSERGAQRLVFTCVHIPSCYSIPTSTNSCSRLHRPHRHFSSYLILCIPHHDF